ncbi:hypothetical protein niasHS_014687 [Heterodera schachtii]|uniref:Uncharacterized protein n=1 Tax=Heterodera schachtii TaxID=97005 RepID=A0ABD2IM39_HETSC
MDGPPPPPMAKPGRIRMFRSLKQFVPTKAGELKLCGEDIVYVKEAPEGTECCEAKSATGHTEGILPRQFVEQHMELIEFPLHEAARAGDLAFLRECLDNKMSVNGLDRSGSTALHWAAYAGHTPILKHLLSVPNVTILAQNKLGDSPLHAASAKGRLDCVHLLVEAGANAHVRNRRGQRPVDVTGDPQVGALLKTTMTTTGDGMTEGDEDYLEEEDDEGEEHRPHFGGAN